MRKVPALVRSTLRLATGWLQALLIPPPSPPPISARQLRGFKEVKNYDELICCCYQHSLHVRYVFLCKLEAGRRILELRRRGRDYGYRYEQQLQTHADLQGVLVDMMSMN